MYSDMSIRTIAFSVSNRNSASALASSVLPTPVGPRKMNEPIGRSGSPNPAAALLLGLPFCLHRTELLTQVRKLLGDRVAPLDRRLGGLLLHRGLLDLELDDAPLDDVDLVRHGVDLDLQSRRGLVDQVD